MGEDPIVFRPFLTLIANLKICEKSYWICDRQLYWLEYAIEEIVLTNATLEKG